MITIETIVNAPVEKVWKYWITPEDIMQWNQASDDWHTPSASVDLRPGGEFHALMAAKDGSFQFDFGGVYDEVTEHRKIAYTLGDGRKVEVHFTQMGDQTHVRESFEPESTNPHEMQRSGWQAILNSFKQYTERS